MLQQIVAIAPVILALGIVSGAGPGAAGATERLVPSQYPTIQAAIDASANGDVVTVADGVYTGTGNRDIDFGGKTVTVRSEHGPASCIIDCQASWSSRHRGFYFHTSETAAAIVDGLTIRNGIAPYSEACYASGGGILCEYANPVIRNCIIRENTAET
jgi:hypothetical protein